MQKYIGKFRVFGEITADGEPSGNNHDTYLKFRTGQIYRFNRNTLVLILTTTNSIKKYIPALQDIGVKIKEYAIGDSEAIFLFPEKQIDIVTKIMKPQIKGKNIKPNSVKTQRRLIEEVQKNRLECFLGTNVSKQQ